MIYCRLVTHTIKAGDTLYLLARQYHTTVPAITLMNPGINPYNLPIGETLKICMGETEKMQSRPQMSERQLWSDMRENIAANENLTAMYLNSVVFDTPDRDAVKNRMMQTPEALTDIFTMFYSDEDAGNMKRLMQQNQNQMVSMAEAVSQARDEEASKAAVAMQQGSKELAGVLSSGNPSYNRQELEQMMVRQTNAACEQMRLMMDGRYPQALMVYEDASSEGMKMADYLTGGLIENFYRTEESMTDRKQ